MRLFRAVFLLVLMVSLASFTQTASAGKTKPKNGKPFVGTIQTVSSDKLTVKHKKETMTFNLTAKTKYKGDVKDASGLKKGQHVSVRHKGKDATSVRVGKGKKMGGK